MRHITVINNKGNYCHFVYLFSNGTLNKLIKNCGFQNNIGNKKTFCDIDYTYKHVVTNNCIVIKNITTKNCFAVKT